MTASLQANATAADHRDVRRTGAYTVHFTGWDYFLLCFDH